MRWLNSKVKSIALHNRALPDSRCVTEPKGHDEGLEKSEGTFEGSLSLVAMLDADVIVSPTDVELCEVAGALQLVDKFGDQG